MIVTPQASYPIEEKSDRHCIAFDQAENQQMMARDPATFHGSGFNANSSAKQP